MDLYTFIQMLLDNIRYLFYVCLCVGFQGGHK